MGKYFKLPPGAGGPDLSAGAQVAELEAKSDEAMLHYVFRRCDERYFPTRGSGDRKGHRVRAVRSEPITYLRFCPPHLPSQFFKIFDFDLF